MTFRFWICPHRWALSRSHINLHVPQYDMLIVLSIQCCTENMGQSQSHSQHISHYWLIRGISFSQTEHIVILNGHQGHPAFLNSSSKDHIIEVYKPDSATCQWFLQLWHRIGRQFRLSVQVMSFHNEKELVKQRVPASCFNSTQTSLTAKSNLRQDNSCSPLSYDPSLRPIYTMIPSIFGPSHLEIEQCLLAAIHHTECV